MARQIVFTPKAAKPPATYSQAVKAAGLVFVSGTAPSDPVTGQITGETIQEQTRQCLANIAAILEEAGSSLDKIVSATVVLADEDDFAGMNEEWLQVVSVESAGSSGCETSREDSRAEDFDCGDRGSLTSSARRSEHLCSGPKRRHRPLECPIVASKKPRRAPKFGVRHHSLRDRPGEHRATTSLPAPGRCHAGRSLDGFARGLCEAAAGAGETHRRDSSAAGRAIAIGCRRDRADPRRDRSHHRRLRLHAPVPRGRPAHRNRTPRSQDDRAQLRARRQRLVAVVGIERARGAPGAGDGRETRSA